MFANAGSDVTYTILHVMRSPVGGLFRHVADLARAQAARGHRVGIIADASTGGERAETALAALDRDLGLGVTRIPMSRELGPSDMSAVVKVRERVRAVSADVLHGHGAKGGAYARLVGSSALKVYTPHGGSLHYSRTTPVGFVYLTLESVLAGRTDLFLFESAYGRDTFRAKVCEPGGEVRVVHNGVGPEDFATVVRAPDATDLLFIGELRALKGVDVLIRALAQLKEQGRPLTATIVGAGPEADEFHALSRSLGLGDAIRFPGALPARQAFTMGRILVVPSRAESLPYVVLEAGAAGVPLIASRVGGIAEIMGPDQSRLVSPGEPATLAQAILRDMDDETGALARATALRERIRSGFSVDAMAEGVIAAYGAAFMRRVPAAA